ncbi:glycosyltransferase family 4 protein [Ekhidna sp.]
MKIGVVVDNDYYKDVRVTREVRLLETYGFEVFVLCLTFKKPVEEVKGRVSIIPVYIHRRLKNTLYFFMNSFPFYELWWKKHISEFIKRFDLDVVHTHDLYMSKCAKMGIKSSGKPIPLILDLHENYPHAVQSYKWTQGSLRSLLSRPKKWIKKEKEYLDYADRIVVLSEDFKNLLTQRYQSIEPKTLTVFPNVVDIEVFDEYEIQDVSIQLQNLSPLRVLYFGMVASRRGIFRTLKSCEELLLEGKDFSLIIIGPVDAGDKDQFFAEISKPIFKQHLIYIPWIDLPMLPSYLLACDIALAPFDKNPQHESGIANKIFQYMYGKLPIVASNCKPQQELIENHDIGKIFASDQEFTQQLRWMIDNEEERKNMGERAFKTLMNNYHQNAFKDTFISLYTDLKTG